MIDFDEFWKIWPVKKAKAPAKKAWDKLNVTEEMFEKMVNDIRMKLYFREWDLTKKQFIPHASTYLNQQRFLDEDYIDRRAPSQKASNSTIDQDFVELHTDRSWAEGLE